MKTPMKYIFLSLAILMLTACGAESTPNAIPTNEMGVSDAVIRLVEQGAIQQVTQQAINNARLEEQAAQTATQAIAGGTATARAETQNRQATAQVALETKRVFDVTVEAAKLHEAQTITVADNRATSTVEAQKTSTQMAVTGITATVAYQGTAMSAQKTQQAPIDEAKLKALNAEAASAQLAYERELATNSFTAWGPWVFAFACLVALGFVLIKKSEVGVIKDGQGHTELVKIGKDVIKPANMERPLIHLGKLGATSPDLGVTADIQRQSTREANTVAGIRALPQWMQQQAKTFLGDMMGSRAPGVQIQVLQPGQMGSIRGELEEQLAGEVVDD